MRFTKMQGCGNDYIYVNCFEESVSSPQELAKAVSNRHFGIGSDGLVLILPSDIADCRMRMFNSDGSESEMCGNAIRCVAKYVYDRDIIHSRKISVETLAGIKYITINTDENDIARTMIGRYETTDQLPSLDTLVRVADALGTSIDYLLGRTDSPDGQYSSNFFQSSSSSHHMPRTEAELEALIRKIISETASTK